MMRAAEADCMVALLSPAYFESEHCLAELHAALASDPLGVQGRILPVLVERFELPRLVGHLAYIDVAGSDEWSARQRIAVALSRHAQLDTSNQALRSKTRRVVEQANRNRMAMIEKVRTIWIKGVLEKSLFHQVRIELSMIEQPDAVIRPMDAMFWRPDGGDIKRTVHTKILEAFDSMDKSLLILGAPGSGKTTLLLELARDLLDRGLMTPRTQFRDSSTLDMVGVAGVLGRLDS